MATQTEEPLQATYLVKSEFWKKAEDGIMTQAADADMELLKWPIAPDGYIPNSVIREVMMKVKKQRRPDCREDLFKAKCLDEGATSDETARNSWFVAVEDGEEEIAFEVKRERSEKDVETSMNEDNKQNAVGKGGDKMKVKERIDAFKPMHQRKEDGGFVYQKLPDIHAESSLSKNLKVSTENTLVPQKREIGLSLENTDSLIRSRPESVEIRPHPPLRELQDKTELREDTPPLQSLSTPKQSGIIPREWLKSPVVSAEAAISKKALDAQTVNQRTQINTTAPPLLKPPPPSSEDHQPPEVCFPESSAVQHPNILLSAAKYDNINNQSQLALSLQVLALYRKSKVHPPRFPPQNKRLVRPYLPVAHISVEFHGQNRNLRGIALFSASLTDINRQQRSNIQPERPSPSHPANTQLTLPQLLCPIRDTNKPLPGINTTAPPLLNAPPPSPEDHQPQHPNILLSAAKYDNINNQSQLALSSEVLALYRKSKVHPPNKPMPEWRKTQHQQVSLRGFRSSRAAKQFAAEHPQKPPCEPQPPVTIPKLQRGQAEAHQRVIQKIELKDSTEPTHCCFSQVFPLASQQTFVTSHQCGKTQYGKLQFDWTSGY